MFKGKFKEGEKAEPATWKTRLRCALNKSPDFEEVTERSQLDISEPYKVYRIVPEEDQKREFKREIDFLKDSINDLIIRIVSANNPWIPPALIMIIIKEVTCCDTNHVFFFQIQMAKAH